MKPSILIVEDELPIAELIAMTLRVNGYETHLCQDGSKALALLRENRHSLVVLDVMLPGMDGFAIAETLLAEGRELPPILYLTARRDVADRVRGLRLGAEDYLLKPFHPVELQARVEAILRRHKVSESVYRALDVALDLNTRVVKSRGQPVDLTQQEFELLALLMRHKNMALSREQLLQAAWGYDYLGGTRTVDMHIQRLRAKLGWEEAIKTIYKLGYRLEAP